MPKACDGVVDDLTGEVEVSLGNLSSLIYSATVHKGSCTAPIVLSLLLVEHLYAP